MSDLFTLLLFVQIFIILVDVDAIEESSSLKMFGEEDAEDKLDEKIILANEGPGSLLEEIKQVALEEDEKQPAEPSPDQPQDKNSEDEIAKISEPVR